MSGTARRKDSKSGRPSYCKGFCWFKAKFTPYYLFRWDGVLWYGTHVWGYPEKTKWVSIGRDAVTKRPYFFRFPKPNKDEIKITTEQAHRYYHQLAKERRHRWVTRDTCV